MSSEVGKALCAACEAGQIDLVNKIIGDSIGGINGADVNEAMIAACEYNDIKHVLYTRLTQIIREEDAPGILVDACGDRRPDVVRELLRKYSADIDEDDAAYALRSACEAEDRSCAVLILKSLYRRIDRFAGVFGGEQIDAAFERWPDLPEHKPDFEGVDVDVDDLGPKSAAKRS